MSKNVEEKQAFMVDKFKIMIFNTAEENDLMKCFCKDSEIQLCFLPYSSSK